MASPPPMPAPVSRPKLKISVSQTKIGTPTQSAAATPLTTPGGRTKIVLKGIASSQTPGDQSSTPATVATPVTSTTTKAGRQTKPTAKKRQHDELGDDPAPEVRPPPKKAKHIKILPVTPSTPKDAGRSIVIKHIGKAPKRPPGDGYDSEASDKEDDPAIEEQIMFRMLPGEDCDFLRQQVMENKLGSGKENPGFSLLWLEEETRRALVTVRGQVYVGVLVDLPTVTEGMKTFDRKNIMKTADISQMLLIFQKVASADEARKVALPATLESSFRWPHGITPPMHDCVHRRFSKKISRKEIEDKEAEVERLLNIDRQAKSTRYEYVDDRSGKTPAPDDEDDDAEGEEEDGYFPHQGETEVPVEDDPDFEEALEAAFEEVEAETPVTQVEGVTPITAAATPATGIRETVETDEGTSEEEDDDDDDDDDDEDLGEDEQARMDEVKGVRAMIADLRSQLKAKEAERQKAINAIIIRRLEDSIRKLKSEIQLKMSSIGEEEDEPEDD